MDAQVVPMEDDLRDRLETAYGRYGGIPAIARSEGGAKKIIDLALDEILATLTDQASAASAQALDHTQSEIRLGDTVRMSKSCPHGGDWRNAKMKVVSLRIDPEGRQWASVIEGEQRHRGNGVYDGETTDIRVDYLDLVSPQRSPAASAQAADLAAPAQDVGGYKPDIRSTSISRQDRRCLLVWFGQNVTSEDRKWLLDAANAVSHSPIVIEHLESAGLRGAKAQAVADHASMLPAIAASEPLRGGAQHQDSEPANNMALATKLNALADIIEEDPEWFANPEMDDGDLIDTFRGAATALTSLTVGETAEIWREAETTQDEKTLLMQARYVLRSLNAERPGCGYDKLAAACDRASSQLDTSEPTEPLPTPGA
jgi:hypothetical protein